MNKSTSNMKARVTTAVAACAVMGLGLSGGTALGAVEYTVIDVRAFGEPDGIMGSRPADDGLNSLGDVVGTGAVTGGSTRPFYFKYPAGPVLNLGDFTGDFGLGGNDISRAHSINDLGWVVGSARNIIDGLSPFLYRDDNGNGVVDPGELRDLGWLPGTYWGSARAINNAMQVVIAGGTGNYLWNDDNDDLVVDAAELTLITTNSSEFVIAAMNENGDLLWADAGIVYRWIDANDDRVQDASEVATFDFTVFGGSSGGVYDMNNNGQVCGYMKDYPLNSSRGFIWTDANQNNVAEPSEFQDLGNPWYTNFFVRAINDHGQAVGGIAYSNIRDAHVWDPVNGLRNLNALIDPSLGYELRQAEAINNDGQIALYARFAGTTAERVLLLTPRVKPDRDYDGDVDMDDFDAFLQCMAGPAIPVTGGCEEADLDGDNDVDVADGAAVQRCVSGSGVPVWQGCDD